MTTVFASELSYDLVEEDVRSYFGSCGDIEAIDMFMNRSSGWFTGQARITFKTVEAFEKALALDGEIWFDRAIRVMKAREREQRVEVAPKPRPSTVPGSTATLYVGHVDWSCSADQLSDALSSVGEIVNIRMPQNLNEVAFVTFTKPEHVERALEELQGIQVCGRQLLLDRGESKPWDKVAPGSTKTLFLSGIPLHTSEETLTQSVGHFGEVDSIRFLNKRSDKGRVAFVCFKEADAVERAMDAYDQEGIAVEETSLVASRAEERKRKARNEPEAKSISSDTVYVKNLGKQTSPKELQQLFSAFGKVTDVKIPTDLVSNENRGFGFVTFESTQCAEACISNRNPLLLQGNRRVFVSWRTTKNRKRKMNLKSV